MTDAANGPDETEQRDVDGHRAGDGGSVPAELCLERHHQHARRRADAGGYEQDDERDGGDDPRVVEPATRHDTFNLEYDAAIDVIVSDSASS